jgi:hypothetical protein
MSFVMTSSVLVNREPAPGHFDRIFVAPLGFRQSAACVTPGSARRALLLEFPAGL